MKAKFSLNLSDAIKGAINVKCKRKRNSDPFDSRQPGCAVGQLHGSKGRPGGGGHAARLSGPAGGAPRGAHREVRPAPLRPDLTAPRSAAAPDLRSI